jgi:hypothetical protein
VKTKLADKKDGRLTPAATNIINKYAARRGISFRAALRDLVDAGLTLHKGVPLRASPIVR